MLIVAGSIHVDATARDGYVAECVAVVTQAREAPGCLDFAITADSLDPTRVDVYERWESVAAVEAFRGSGPSGDQQAAIAAADVSQYEVGAKESLT